MGKRPTKGGGNDHKKSKVEHAERRNNSRGDGDQPDRWATVVYENARFEAFYKAQHFTHGPEDWGKLMEHFKMTLPACFRINPDYDFVDTLKSELLGYVGSTFKIDEQEIRAVENINWYPSGLAYKLGTDRRSIRKLDALNDLHKWMMQHTDNGNITRQEAVSMVPPLVLDVQPHHRCIDMCAAPGSKTSQLLEVVNRSVGRAADEQGLVVANDADTDRAFMLVHQCRRINSPLLIVTNHKGQMFPGINAKSVQANRAGEAASKEFFDRVLCDVPCSGDGTLRKNPSIWGKWSTLGGMTLHPLQLMIAQRGVQLLKAGGLLVYSTCSMSPYENEAVVAELLRSSNGKLELVDARAMLPGFKARTGLSQWHVLDDVSLAKKDNDSRAQKAREEAKPAQKAAKKPKFSFTFATDSPAVATPAPATAIEETAVADSGSGAIELRAETEESAVCAAAAASAATTEPSAEEKDRQHVERAGGDEELLACLRMGMQYYKNYEEVSTGTRSRIKASMFPPSDEEAAWMRLALCLRCVPQDEDTGGFFVAALRKKEEPTAAAPTAAAVTAAAATADEDKNDKEEELLSLGDLRQWDKDSFTKIRDFYGLDSTIPADSMFVRDDFETGSKKKPQSKSVYYLPATARKLLQSDRTNQLKIITAGIKMFERKVTPNKNDRDYMEGGTMEADYRLMQDGIHYFAPHMSKRIVNVTVQDFCNMLGGGLVSQTTLSTNCLEQLSDLSAGTVIAKYTYSAADVNEGRVALKDARAHELHIVCWKGPSRTLNVMAGKIDIDDMKHQLDSLGVLREKVVSARSAAIAAATAAAGVAATAPAEKSEVVAEVAPASISV